MGAGAGHSGAGARVLGAGTGCLELALDAQEPGTERSRGARHLDDYDRCLRGFVGAQQLGTQDRRLPDCPMWKADAGLKQGQRGPQRNCRNAVG